MEKLNLDIRALKRFEMTMGVVFLVISGSFFFRHKYSKAVFIFTVSCIFFAARLFFPIFLRPVYAAWMRFAYILGWVNTRIILVIMFYIIFTPIGLFIRLLRIDLLERKKKERTYWKKKVEFNLLNYERRF